jgi:hypothetical protein
MFGPGGRARGADADLLLHADRRLRVLLELLRHGFELGGRYWPTAEHYFQAQKFAGTEYAEHVARARTPKEAAARGRSRAVPLRPDWEAVKDGVMRAAVRRKFEAHADIRAVLLGTGDEDLVENAPGDYYWGCGADGSGRNMLSPHPHGGSASSFFPLSSPPL